MLLQQLVALALVGIAAGFLTRNLMRAVRATVSGKGGCSSGCGKCSFAPSERDSAETSSSSPEIIPLTDIRVLAGRQKK